MSEQPPEGGHEGGGHKGFALHLPVWGWALIIGAGAGLVYFVRKKQAAASAASSTTDTSGTGTDSTPTQDIIPVDEGGDDKSDADLLAAINKLQGTLSTPTGVTGQPKPGPVPVPVPTPPKKKPPTKPPAGPSSHFVSIDSYEDLVEVAKAYGHTASELWAYQLEKGVRPAKTQAELKREGVRNAWHNGSSVAVPTSWKKK